MSFVRFKVFIALMVVFFLILGSFFYVLDAVSKPASQVDEVVGFNIKSGEGIKEISNNLQTAGLIKNKSVFQVYTYFIRVNDELKAGQYSLSKKMTIKQITDVLKQGGLSANERWITVTPGQNKNDIADYLEKQGIVKKEDFIKAVDISDSRQIIPSKTYEFLKDKAQGQGLEGYLFPDTYRIFINAGSAGIIEKMLDNFNQKLTLELKEAIESRHKTIYEIVTMASILEKEVTKETDRKMVSDIFWRRIDAGMPLQSDATVNYVTGKSSLQPLISDTQVDSPYNTYLYKGLPPGPICNPSLDSIKAAIYPKENDYWYYLTKKDGATVFAKTAEEHVENKAKYLD